MLSSFFILAKNGEPLIVRHFDCNSKSSVCDVFNTHAVTSASAPFFTVGNTTYFYVWHNGLAIVATTRGNTNVAVPLEFLNTVVPALSRVLNGASLSADLIQANFILVYRALDEMLDSGLPQVTQPDVLASLVNSEDPTPVYDRIIGPYPWRCPGIEHEKNQIFVDIVETLNLVLSSQGDVLRQLVDGCVQVRSHLSGTPQCKLAFNNDFHLGLSSSASLPPPPICVDSCQLDESVQAHKFLSDHTLSFVPPDGECNLMLYQISTNISAPFSVKAKIHQDPAKVSYSLDVSSRFPEKFTATAVVLRIPTPQNTLDAVPRASIGKAKIRQWPANTAATLEANVTLHPSDIPWTRPPIILDFQILMYPLSGLFVKYLKVYETSEYHSTKWVRYVSKAGSLDGLETRIRPIHLNADFLLAVLQDQGHQKSKLG